MDLVGAYAIGPLVDQLQITLLFAVHLGQRDDMLECGVLGRNQSENFRALDVQTSGTGKVNFKT